MKKKHKHAVQSNDGKPIYLRGTSYTVEEATLLAIDECTGGRRQVAVDVFDRIIARVPNHAEAHYNRGIVLLQMERLEEALGSFDRALALNPSYAEAYNNRGYILLAMKRYEEAVAAFDQAIAFNPGFAMAYNNRGMALQEVRRYADAVASCNAAIALSPGLACAYHNRGMSLHDLKRYDDALSSFAKARELDPDMSYSLGLWISTKMYLCDWQGISAAFKLLSEQIEAGITASSPFVLLATPLSIAIQRKCAEIHVKGKFPEAVPGLWIGERYSHDRIRVGYFSSDLHGGHPLGNLMAEMFELHDRSKFEVTAFSLGPSMKDDMRMRLEKAFDQFIDVRTKTDSEIAALAKSMEIDIALDLNGLTAGARTGIVAMRPAPVQVSYMGYPGTMGANYIDYLVADATVVPEEHKQYYTEKIVHLPYTYWVTDSMMTVSEIELNRHEMGLPRHGFVFCCFNNSYKLSHDVFTIWMRLLNKVEGSVLWLLEGNESAAKNLRAEAIAHGISEERLVFAKRTDREKHLARQRLADLFLDTLYYNAHTTTSDALWAGLPVVTCLGPAFAGRVAASQLNAVNLPELVTHSQAEYEALALELATTPQKLYAIRQKLSNSRTKCPLFDTRLFTKYFEDALVQMWKRSQAGLPPDHIQVSP